MCFSKRIAWLSLACYSPAVRERTQRILDDTFAPAI